MLKWYGLVFQMGDNRWRFPTDGTQDIVRFFVIWAPKEVIIRISKVPGPRLGLETRSSA